MRSNQVLDYDATLRVTLTTDGFERLSDVPSNTVDGIERFLIEYSSVEGNTIQFGGTCSRKKALAMIEEDRMRFNKHAQ